MGECWQQKHIQHAPSMKTEYDYLYGWIKKKKKVTCARLTKNGEPQRYSWEQMDYSISSTDGPLQIFHTDGLLQIFHTDGLFQIFHTDGLFQIFRTDGLSLIFLTDGLFQISFTEPDVHTDMKVLNQFTATPQSLPLWTAESNKTAPLLLCCSRSFHCYWSAPSMLHQKGSTCTWDQMSTSSILPTIAKMKVHEALIRDRPFGDDSTADPHPAGAPAADTVLPKPARTLG